MVLKTKKKSKNIQVYGYSTILIILILVLIDRATKIWAQNLKSQIDYGIFAFTHTTNTGAAFSIFENFNIILAIIAFIVLILIINYKKEINNFSFVLIISGILGNLIDRIFFGHVIDFIDLKFWPIFNVADSLIFIGVCYWIIVLLKKK